MTPTFSNIVNFSLKGMLEKVRKLQFISYAEADETIAFPRVKRRLLQIQEETDQTFSLPTESDIAKMIFKAKEDAIKICDNCKIRLNSYDDKHLIKNIEKVVDDAIINDNECEDENDTQLCSSS